MPSFTRRIRSAWRIRGGYAVSESFFRKQACRHEHIHVQGLQWRGRGGPKAGILFGRVLDLDAVLTFEAETVRDTVDEYLDWCAERGKQPEKPFSGKLVLRIAPDVHRDAVIAATRDRKSLNSWLADVVARAAREEGTTA